MALAPPDFAAEIDGIWAHAVATAAKMKSCGGKATRCHYMPQFLQRRWAQNGSLQVRDSNGVVTTYSIKAANNQNKFIPIGFAEDLYTTIDGATQDRATLEILFGSIEDSTHRTLEALKKNNWAVVQIHKKTLALFVAAAFLRMPNSIQAAKGMLQVELNRKGIAGVQVDGNTVHALLQKPFKAIAQSFYADCRWTLIHYQPPLRQTTGDIFLRVASHEGQEPKDVNKLEHWEFHIPLDPEALLVLNGWKSPTEQLPCGKCEGITPLPWDAPGMSHWLL
jgi:Protein of unknown function (DUF4238)